MIFIKGIISFGIILISISAVGQDCNLEMLLQKTGFWKETKGSSLGRKPADLAIEKKVMADLQKMIRSKFPGKGVDVYANSAQNQTMDYMPVNTYVFSMIPLEFYCDGNTIKTVHETSSSFYIGANYFPSEIYDTAHGDRALAEGFNVMYQMPVEKDGAYYFKETEGGVGTVNYAKSSMILITYDGKLPYAYVSKKEFLEKRKKSLAVLQSDDVKRLKDVLKSIDVEKGFKETEYKNDKDKLEKYMRMDYRPMKERYEKQLADVEKKFKPAFDKLNDALSMPAAELAKPAIVKIDPKDYLSYLFTDSEDPFAMILIKPNPNYFNKKISKSSPQFFSVYIMGNPKFPIVAKMMTDLMAAVDVKALKAMLGK